MSLLDKKLKEFKLAREIVDVYRDRVSDDSLTGVIQGIGEEFLYMSLITEEGEKNGISVFHLEDVTRVRMGGNARSAIKALGAHAQTKLASPAIDLSSLESVIESVQAAYGYVNLIAEFLEDDISFIGEVTEQDSEWLILKCYGTMATLEKSSLLLDKGEISRIDAGSKYEESISYLAKHGVGK